MAAAGTADWAAGGEEGGDAAASRLWRSW